MIILSRASKVKKSENIFGIKMRMGRTMRPSRKRLTSGIYILTVVSITLFMTAVKLSTSNIDPSRVIDKSESKREVPIEAHVLRSRDLRTYDESRDHIAETLKVERKLTQTLKPETKVIYRSPPKFKAVTESNIIPYHKNVGSKGFVNSVPLDNFYTVPESSDIVARGRQFDIHDLSLLAPPNEYLDMSTVHRGMYTIVTWSDADRYEAVKERIPGLQQGFMGHKIAVYDVGMTAKQLKEMSEFCQVTVVRFDLSGYPDHVVDTSTHAFRPIIFRAALLEFTIILWMDLDYNLPTNRIQWENMYAMTRRNSGWIQMKLQKEKSPDQRVKIHPNFMEYIPHKVNSTSFLESGTILAFNSERVYTSIIHWWYACALDSRCYNSVTSDYDCNVKLKKFALPHLCRHNDQTILDVLVTNAYGYDTSSYNTFHKSIVHVKTKHNTKDKLKLC